SRVVIGGDVEVAGHCSRAVEQADLHAVTLVAVLLAMIEMLEDPVFNAVGHAAADLAGSRHQSYYPARRVGRSPVVVRALPEASRPSRDFCRLALQPGKIHLVDQRTVAKNPVRHGEPPVESMPSAAIPPGLCRATVRAGGSSMIDESINGSAGC